MDRLSDYDYHLPEELIAQEPLEDRSASRLLWLHRHDGRIEHRQFRDVPQMLRKGDLLVLNDTRVTALRLLGQKSTGGQAELLLLEDRGEGRFVALAKPAKRLQPGARLEFEEGLGAEVLGALEEGRRIVQLYGPDWREKLSTVGRVPLPPYIHRPLDDPGRYQTVYARTGGSAAAPTAGLHFSEPILEKLDQAGVKLARVTLDVGVDTFRPIQVEILEEHQMHGEVCRVPEETVRAVAECEGRVIAVGTTAVRTLESFATGPRQLEVGEKSTRLFIRPGFRFQIIDGMFTNFHMPRTSMLIMLAALASREPVMRAYREAVEEGYRFLSFGDSMLIL